MKIPETEPKRSRRAIVLGVLLSIVFGPVALFAMSLARRWDSTDTVLTSYVGALNAVLFALVPDGTYKGVVVPVATVLGAYVLPIGVVASAISWMILRSTGLALVAGAAAMAIPVLGIAASFVLGILMP